MKRGPKIDGMLGPLRPKTLLLDELAVEQLRVVGDGNLSDGARRAARVAYDRYQRTPDTADAVERLLERPAQLEYDSWDCRALKAPPTSTADAWFQLVEAAQLGVK